MHRKDYLKLPKTTDVQVMWSSSLNLVFPNEDSVASYCMNNDSSVEDLQLHPMKPVSNTDIFTGYAISTEYRVDTDAMFPKEDYQYT